MALLMLLAMLDPELEGVLGQLGLGDPDAGEAESRRPSPLGELLIKATAGSWPAGLNAEIEGAVRGQLAFTGETPEGESWRLLAPALGELDPQAADHPDGSDKVPLLLSVDLEGGEDGLLLERTDPKGNPIQTTVDLKSLPIETALKTIASWTQVPGEDGRIQVGFLTQESEAGVDGSKAASAFMVDLELSSTAVASVMEQLAPTADKAALARIAAGLVEADPGRGLDLRVASPDAEAGPEAVMPKPTVTGGIPPGADGLESRADARQVLLDIGRELDAIRAVMSSEDAVEWRIHGKSGELEADGAVPARERLLAMLEARMFERAAMKVEGESRPLDQLDRALARLLTVKGEASNAQGDTFSESNATTARDGVMPALASRLFSDYLPAAETVPIWKLEAALEALRGKRGAEPAHTQSDLFASKPVSPSQQAIDTEGRAAGNLLDHGFASYGWRSEMLSQASRPLVPDMEPGRFASLLDQQKLLDQIARSSVFRARNGNSEARLHLRPPSLGELHIRVRLENETVVARFMAQTHEAKAIIDANLPQLRDTLSKQGVTVSRFEVEVQSQNSGQSDNAMTGNSAGQGRNAEAGGFNAAGPAGLDNGLVGAAAVSAYASSLDGAVDYFA